MLARAKYCQKTENMTNLPLLMDVQIEKKSFSTSGVLHPLTPTGGFAPWTLAKGSAPDPRYMGSRYRARHSWLSPHFKFRSDAPDHESPTTSSVLQLLSGELVCVRL